MKFTTLFLGAIAALTVSAQSTVTVLATETVTKYDAITKVTMTETLTKISKVHVTVTESITKYRTKTAKVCPSTGSSTQSVMPSSGVKQARAFGAQPLYAREFV